MKLPAWAGRYVGLPFKTDGCDFDGVKCWGLVHLVLKHQAGIVVSTYGALTSDQLHAVAREMQSASQQLPWCEVFQPKLFDVVSMTAMVGHDTNRPHRIEGHAGIMLSPKMLLHIWEETDSVLMPIDHPRICNKILGFYRHEALA